MKNICLDEFFNTFIIMAIATLILKEIGNITGTLSFSFWLCGIITIFVFFVCVVGDKITIYLYKKGWIKKEDVKYI